jgi:hypothetical protein
VLLLAFHEAGWPKRIDNPFTSDGSGCPKARLWETVRALNAALGRPSLRFSADGRGGVSWWSEDTPEQGKTR